MNADAEGGCVPRALLLAAFAAHDADDFSPGLGDKEGGVRAGEIINDPFSLFFNRKLQLTRPEENLRVRLLGDGGDMVQELLSIVEHGFADDDGHEMLPPLEFSCNDTSASSRVRA